MTQRGSASLELALGVLLLMVPVTVAVMSFGPWLERLAFARLAAAETSRAVVVAGGDVEPAMLQIATMASNRGYPGARVRVGLCGATPMPVAAGGASACAIPPERNGSVRARVEVDVPLLVLPWRHDGGTVTVGGLEAAAEHESLVDLYRSLGV